MSRIPLSGAFLLGPDESRHAVKVFRHHEGDLLRIGDGAGVQALGRVISAQPEECRLEITGEVRIAPKPRIHLAVAALKDDDLEEVMETCGQLPLGSLTVLRTAHSLEPRASGMERTLRRLEMKSLAAFKQSMKPWLTTVQGPVALASWLQQVSSKIILCDSTGAPELPRNLHGAQSGDLVLLIGPEGGFSPEEIAFFRAREAAVLSLGSTRLRAKTCPIVALGALLGSGVQFAAVTTESL
ncbi:MAG TPA: RsmE family RNA methyltransferase [Fibrobacteraceae bacterium]|nr:RsmE family RNA methyltransferase [Fibrobacteraceae bacterium]